MMDTSLAHPPLTAPPGTRSLRRHPAPNRLIYPVTGGPPAGFCADRHRLPSTRTLYTLAWKVPAESGGSKVNQISR